MVARNVLCWRQLTPSYFVASVVTTDDLRSVTFVVASNTAAEQLVVCERGRTAKGTESGWGQAGFAVSLRMATQTALAQVLEQTLNPSYAKQGNHGKGLFSLRRPCSLTLLAAESTLKTEAKTRPDFLTSLLNLIASADVSLPIRQAAALFFKNFVREHWKVRNTIPSLDTLLTPCYRTMHWTSGLSRAITAISSSPRSLRWSPWSLPFCNCPWETQLASSPTQTSTRIGLTSFL